MLYVYEIFLTKKFISKEEWLELIKIISNYNGILKRWKIIIINSRNQIRYFIKTRCSLPSSINNLDSFFLKKINRIHLPKSKFTFYSIFKEDSNFIDLINYYEIKYNVVLKYIELDFFKIYKDKIISKISLYLNNNKHILLFCVPTSILSIDFKRNKRYCYKSFPKYLEINKILYLLNDKKNNALFCVDTFPYLQGNFYLNKNNYSFDKHSIVIGSSGCGKSKFISLFINNINKSSSKEKYKVVVIDPHSSLEDDIGGIGKVIDFNLSSIDLFINDSSEVVSSTELILDLLKSLIINQYNSKVERVLRHSIYLLLIANVFNFKNLRKLILDLEYRNNLIMKYKYRLPISVVDFFLFDFNDLKTKSYGEAISPIISFIDEMEMLPVFNKYEKRENIIDTIHNNFLTIFSLDRVKLGERAVKTISGLIMQQLFTLIQKREINEHIIFIIDEVAVIENSILSRYLAEARKYNCSLILTCQYFNQISDSLKNSVFANVINYYIFRVSKLDANILVDNLNMKIPLDDSRDTKIRLLTELKIRECIVRIESKGKLLPVFKGYTLDYESIPRSKGNFISNKIINNKDNIIKKEKYFNLDCNVSLKDILISNSTSRKGVL